MSAGKMAALAIGAVLLYLVAWLCAYMAIIGLSLRLAPHYFVLSWKFTGLEQPGLVWLLSWPILSILLLGLYMLRNVLVRPADAGERGASRKAAPAKSPPATVAPPKMATPRRRH